MQATIALAINTLVKAGVIESLGKVWVLEKKQMFLTH